MKRRNWGAEEKMAIVLEGLKGNRSVAELCREHQISQALYYRWRDKFLEAGKKGLVNGAGDEDVYRAEIERLQKITGKQAIKNRDFKKSGRVIREKVRAVEGLKDEGYSVKEACCALDISRSGYYASKGSKAQKDGIFAMKDKELKKKMEEIKEEHVFRGHRRVWAWLRHREKIFENQIKCVLTKGSQYRL